MSSESDDDFQSADEGSDLDSADETKPSTVGLPQAKKLNIAESADDDNEENVGERLSSSSSKSEKPQELLENKAGDIGYQNIPDTSEESSLIGTLKNLSLQVNEQLCKLPEKLEPLDHESSAEESDEEEFDDPPENKFKTFTESVEKDVGKSLIESKKEEVEVSHSIKEMETQSKHNLTQSNPVKDTSNITVVPENCPKQKENEIVEKQKPETKVIDTIKVVETLPQVDIDKSKEALSSISKKTEDIKVTSSETSSESTASNIQSSAVQKPRPIRESKIGMKKPREKLGERLGAKKLGSKIDKKTLEGLGSESLTTLSSEIHLTEKVSQEMNTVKDTQRKQQAQNILENAGTIEEDRAGILQPVSNTEEIDRWQEAHHFNKEDHRSDDAWGGSWGGWGTTLISAASTFSQEVGRGVGSIMETVEGSLGVPDPETLAKEIAERENLKKMELGQNQATNVGEKETTVKKDNFKGDSVSQNEVEDIVNAGEKGKREFSLGGLSSFGSLVSGVSGVFETASTKVLLGGLDTLEVIGRKAMDVIQDGDPGLRKKRAFLANAKPNLSEMLQEARHRAAEEEKEMREGDSLGGKTSRCQGPTFDQAWEATEGCVHMEALSLVAKQCESKMSSLLQTMPHYMVDKIQALNNEIKNACELEEESVLERDFISQIEEVVPLAGLPLQPQKICIAWSHLEETISTMQDADAVDCPTAEREMYTALAALVAQVATVLHKGAELSLITPEADPLNVATQFKELVNAVCGGIENKADEICGIITNETSAANPQVNNTITNIYLQSASGNGYMQQCLGYVASVLQYSNTKQLAAEL